MLWARINAVTMYSKDLVLKHLKQNAVFENFITVDSRFKKGSNVQH